MYVGMWNIMIREFSAKFYTEVNFYIHFWGFGFV